MPKVTGRAAAKKRILGVMSSPEKIAIVSQALFASGEDVKAEASHLITDGAVSGKDHVVSLPHHPPNEDTGDLRNGIRVVQIGPLHVQVQSTSRHAVPLERGTSTMIERPYIGPAARNRRKACVARVKKAVSIAVKRT